MRAESILDGYEAAGAALVDRFEAIDPANLYAPVAGELPDRPARIADIGAGTGRDAAWLAARGHAVHAVEPVAALREAGRRLHPAPLIVWLDDRLPNLERLRATRLCFDLLLMSAVWQHLDPAQRGQALPVLAGLLDEGGRIILSLRHGPGAPARRCFVAPPERTIAAAEQAGLTLVLRREAGSVQPGNRRAGVTWTWLVFRKGPRAPVNLPFVGPA